VANSEERRADQNGLLLYSFSHAGKRNLPTLSQEGISDAWRRMVSCDRTEGGERTQSSTIPADVKKSEAVGEKDRLFSQWGVLETQERGKGAASLPSSDIAIACKRIKWCEEEKEAIPSRREGSSRRGKGGGIKIPLPLCAKT